MLNGHVFPHIVRRQEAGKAAGFICRLWSYLCDQKAKSRQAKRIYLFTRWAPGGAKGVSYQPCVTLGGRKTKSQQGELIHLSTGRAFRVTQKSARAHRGNKAVPKTHTTCSVSLVRETRAASWQYICTQMTSMKPY